jgi:hypothetical protein
MEVGTDKGHVIACQRVQEAGTVAKFLLYSNVPDPFGHEKRHLSFRSNFCHCCDQTPEKVNFKEDILFLFWLNFRGFRPQSLTLFILGPW